VSRSLAYLAYSLESHGRLGAVGRVIREAIAQASGDVGLRRKVYGHRSAFGVYFESVLRPVFDVP
jgi:hypothetical protein